MRPPRSRRVCASPPSCTSARADAALFPQRRASAARALEDDVSCACRRCGAAVHDAGAVPAHRRAAAHARHAGGRARGAGGRRGGVPAARVGAARVPAGGSGGGDLAAASRGRFRGGARALVPRAAAGAGAVRRSRGACPTAPIAFGCGGRSQRAPLSPQFMRLAAAAAQPPGAYPSNRVAARARDAREAAATRRAQRRCVCLSSSNTARAFDARAYRALRQHRGAGRAAAAAARLAAPGSGRAPPRRRGGRHAPRLGRIRAARFRPRRAGPARKHRQRQAA